MSNTFGRLFRATTFGESHGPAVGAVIDGCPARLPLSAEDVQPDLDRRRPGQSDLVTARREADVAQIVSGVDGGVTTGGPIAVLIENLDQRPGDYARLRSAPRPSHADLTYRLKYGVLSASGGGRASARETAARVAAGAVARKLLAVRYGVEVVAWVETVGEVNSRPPDPAVVTRAAVDAHPVRCPDPAAAEAMAEAIRQAQRAGDSVGGVVGCVCRGVPVGWGEPVFGKLNGELARAMMTIPAARGFEVGAGFAAAAMRGSAHNDPYVWKDRRIGTQTNRSGGIQGGISDGEPLLFRVAFKPPATIARPQQSVDWDGRPATVEGGGRHDPCVVPRAVAVVEAMAALVLADAALLAAAVR